MTLIGVMLWVVLGLMGGYIFAYKGYSPKWGIVAGVFGGIPALVVAMCLPLTQEARDRIALETQTQKELAHSRQTQPCPKCRRRNSVVARVCPQCHYRFPRDVPALGGG